MDTDPFETLRAYDTRTTWQTARSRGADPEIVDRTLREVPDVSPLGALAASREAVARLEGRRWSIMQDAREGGASWAEIGGALGVSETEARESYTQAIENRERFVPDMHDAARARAALGEGDTPGRQL